jgi:aminoglycoside phosphotransferase (APT) family kinase protein
MKLAEEFNQREQTQSIRTLLNHLASTEYAGSASWQDWYITRLMGGQNNLLYRATSSLGDWVVKFTIRDKRNRAGREYQALSALKSLRLSIAPTPLLVDLVSYSQPVVVQTWIKGEKVEIPPLTDAEWEKLVQHFAVIRTVTPANSLVQLSKAVLNARNAQEGRTIVQQQLARMPKEAHPASLQALIRRFQRMSFPDWAKAPIALCRVDPNPSNFIRRPDEWATVDWENSGWGDPAFEIADLMTHPAYVEVPTLRWEWVIRTYCELVHDPTAEIRVRTYYKIMLVWWVVRLARYLYEVPLGLDNRLAPRPIDWQTKIQRQYEHYLNQAMASTFCPDNL